MLKYALSRRALVLYAVSSGMHLSANQRSGPPFGIFTATLLMQQSRTDLKVNIHRKKQNYGNKAYGGPKASEWTWMALYTSNCANHVF